MAEPTDEECPLCADIDEALGKLLAIFSDTIELKQHALAAIISWWVKAALQTTDDDPTPLARCFANALTDAGIATDVKAGLLAVVRPPTDPHRN